MSGVMFRCDSSPAIGAGHVMRCLAFAETLSWAGWNCAFVSNREAAATVPALGSSGYKVVDPNDQDARSACESVSSLAIVDHYGLDVSFERKLATADCAVVVFDDLADRPHACDILVDPTPGRTADEYAPYVPTSARLLLGPSHAVIGRRWRSDRSVSCARHTMGGPVRRIIVSMGATDPTDATSRVLAALAASRLDVSVDIILGSSAPHLERVMQQIGPGMTLHTDSARLPTLVAQADLAIGAPGSSSFERAVLGLPSILIPIADNQRFIAAAFSKAGAAEILPAALLDDPITFGRRIAEVAEDGDRRASMSQAAALLTDGRGTLRLLAAIGGATTTKEGARVCLRAVDASDSAWLLELQRQPTTRRFARKPAIPSADEHAAWFKRLLDDDDRLLAIVEADDLPSGMIRLDKTSNDPVTLEISVAIHQDHQGKGLRRAALALVRRLAPAADLVATILPENRASQALFAAAGYQPESDRRYRSRAG